VEDAGGLGPRRNGPRRGAGRPELARSNTIRGRRCFLVCPLCTGGTPSTGEGRRTHSHGIRGVAEAPSGLGMLRDVPSPAMSFLRTELPPANTSDSHSGNVHVPRPPVNGGRRQKAIRGPTPLPFGRATADDAEPRRANCLRHSVQGPPFRVKCQRPAGRGACRRARRSAAEVE
jgi:hypothetical protein